MDARDGHVGGEGRDCPSQVVFFWFSQKWGLNIFQFFLGRKMMKAF